MACRNPEAFPRPASKGLNYVTGEEDNIDSQKGMDLLDYFAAHAAQGMLVGADRPSPQEIARLAYDIGEALLDVRAARHVE